MIKMNKGLELKILSLFIAPSKRKRLMGFLESNHREKVIGELNSPGIFDERYIKELKGNQRSSGFLVEAYKKLGMGGRVYVISENEEWDGNKFQMSYILEQSLGACVDTLGYCWKSETAFYEWHHSGCSYFLSRRNDQWFS